MWLNIGRQQHHSKLPIPLSMITIAQINKLSHTRQNVYILPLVCVKIDFYPKIVVFNLYTRGMPLAVVKTQFYALQHVLPAVTRPKLSGVFLTLLENLHLLKVFCLGPFWYTQQLCFRLTPPSHISHSTDTILTPYDTGRTEIPFGPFNVCIWVSPFLVHDSPIEGTAHQCPFRGISAEPLN
jgi:hypothetical protein